jgi:glucosyl-dolichyl phosphate glucuronosyltransferase
VPSSVEWEVLVVDNNSKDKTRVVVQEFCDRYPGRYRYFLEPLQGLSNARNSGIREARGDIVAFVDDDVTVEPAWLQNLTAELLDGKWAGAGGRIRPHQGFVPPDWLNLGGEFYLDGSLVLFDLGDNACELDQPPFGTNMAFQRAMFEKYGGFRTDLGRCGDSLIGNEETEFGQRLKAGGERLWYVPSAVVYHPVPEQRLKKSYLRRWWYSYGRSIVRQTGKGPSIREVPGFYLRRLKGGLRWMFFSNPDWPLYPDWRFYAEIQVCLAAGEIVEILRLARQKASNDKAAVPGSRELSSHNPW